MFKLVEKKSPFKTAWIADNVGADRNKEAALRYNSQRTPEREKVRAGRKDQFSEKIVKS